MIEMEKPSILIVDDRPENLLALESLLDDHNLTIIKANSGNEALGVILEHDVSLVLLDVQMPDMDGFETAELMRSTDRSRHIPIIFVTAINKEKQHIFKGYEAGAVDYLFKPLDPDILKSKVSVFLELDRQKKFLETANEELRLTIQELKRANQKIIEQHKSVIEEERLKVLLQMAGATAHELNQPLTGLLGYIELLRLNSENPVKMNQYMDRIQEAGMRISDIVKKIQYVRHYENRPYLNTPSPNEFSQKVHTLSLDDSDDDFEILKGILSDHDQIHLTRVTGIEPAIQLLESNRFDMIFLEYFLPDGNGLDFMKLMTEKQLETPVVVITGKGNEMIASRVIQGGAFDYLPKDKLSDKSLFRIIGNTLEKARLKRETGEALKKLAEMSTKDELTRLYNRRFFNEALLREFSRARRYKTELVLCLMDLDHFKQVNDTFGHQAGDMVLCDIGTMLKGWTRMSDLVCRFGGEEFAIILPNTTSGMAVETCERFRKMIAAHRFKFDKTQFSVTMSTGLVSFQESSAETPEDLIALADKALYQAKETGRNRVVNACVMHH